MARFVSPYVEGWKEATEGQESTHPEILYEEVSLGLLYFVSCIFIPLPEKKWLLIKASITSPYDL